MSINMLVFDYRDTENSFFENNELQNFKFKFYKESLTPETVKTIPQDIKDETTVISVFVNSQVTKEVIDEFKNLRIITTRSTGYDHINSTATAEKNIAIINVQNYGATSVAQYTFGLILALVRNIIPAALCIKGIQTSRINFTGRDLSKMSIGVVGTGAIGSAVCKLAEAFNMKILAYDLKMKNELVEKCEVEYVDLPILLENSDIVTLHAPYTGENYHMIGKKEIDMMKQNAYLINTSRGELISLEELYNNLINNKLSGAALDVVSCEYVNFRCHDMNKSIGDVPLECVKENDYMLKLAELQNVIITPHIAYDTQDAVNYILQNTIDQIRDIIKSGHVFGVL